MVSFQSSYKNYMKFKFLLRTGEVIIHRLNFQRIWTHPPPTGPNGKDGIKVRGIDFRPDEKIIAIGTSSSYVIYFDQA